MPNRLAELVQLAKKRVKDGYYDTDVQTVRHRKSLVSAIRRCRLTPIISEIKYASPSQGKIRSPESPPGIAKQMLAGGACAISVLTDPDSFQGGLHILKQLSNTEAPLIMKDIVVSTKQLEAANNCGADSVVLIWEIFANRDAETGLGEMIKEAKRRELETLVETNSPEGFEQLMAHKPDLYGINNRDLSTFEVDLKRTVNILNRSKMPTRPVVSESGIESPNDIHRLRAAGAQAFLIGTSIMKSPNLEEKVRELVNA